MTLTPVTVRVRAGVRPALADVVEEFKSCRTAWGKLPRFSVTRLPAAEAAAVRAQRRRFFAELRQGGLLLDSIDQVAAAGIRAELEARGWWDRSWRTVPETGKLKGRWPATGRGDAFPEAVPMRLPSPLARKVHAACWHTSAPAIARLRSWEEPAEVERRQRQDLDDAAEYQRLAASVTTVGDVCRAGLDRGIALGQALAPEAWALVAAAHVAERTPGQLHTSRTVEKVPLDSPWTKAVRLAPHLAAWRDAHHAGTLDPRLHRHLDRLGMDWNAEKGSQPQGDDEIPQEPGQEPSPNGQGEGDPGPPPGQ